jgi:hypothetical protein
MAGLRLRRDPTDPSGDGYRSSHALEVPELGVLVTVLHLLRATDPVVISGMSASARWPRREPPLVPAENLKRALLELRREGWLAFRVEGDEAHVSYGERVGEIASAWGIELTEREAVAP